MTHHRVKSGELVFDVHTYGPDDGIPIVLLHGWPQDALSWRKVATLLAQVDYRVIVPDQRGYSPNARPEGVENYHIDVLVDDVLMIAQKFGLEAFHLVGHDWGAAVAWRAAANHPERIPSITAVAVPHVAAFTRALETNSDQKESSGYIGLLRIEGKAERVLAANDSATLRGMYGEDLAPEEVERYVSKFAEPHAMTSVLNWYRAMGADLKETPHVSQPATYLWGNKDIAISRYAAELGGDFVKGEYEFVEVDGGHWLLDTHPDLVANHIIKRVKSAM